MPIREATKDDGGVKTNAISHASPNKAHVADARVATLMYLSTSSSLLCTYDYAASSNMLLDFGNAQ